MPTTIAANMMVLNAAAVLPRCLRSMRGALDELVVIDTGSTDDTFEVLTALVKEHGIGRLHYERMHPLGPDFFTDEAESFKMALPGPHTGKRIPSDWAAVRNLALDNTRSDYIIKLDADDEALCSSDKWREAAAFLDSRPEISLISAPYEVYDGQGNIEWLSMYDRMWRRLPRRNCPPLRWTMPCHEYLRGKKSENTLFCAQGLRVRDWRDSPGGGVRVPHRNLKVLLHAWEQGERRTIFESDNLAADLVERFTLAHEAAEILPDLALQLLTKVLQDLDPADLSMKSDCYYHLGRTQVALSKKYAGESRQAHDDMAITMWKLADSFHPHTQALLLLHKLLAEQGDVEQASWARNKILARVGSSPSGPLVFNCDLKLLRALQCRS